MNLFLLFIVFFVWIFTNYIYGKNVEQLHIFPLGSNKNLLHFSFDFEEAIEMSQNNEIDLWPNSLFEVLIKNEGVRYAKIEMSNGYINPFFKDVYSFPFETPERGTKLYLNPEANYKASINSLTEIFTFERKVILQENNFLVDLSLESELSNKLNKLDFPEKFIFANSPDDFLCVEAFEKLREYVGCGGTKGLYSLLELNRIFKSEYVSLLGYLTYDETTKNIKYGIEINLIIDYDNKEIYFQTKNLQACFGYDEAKIIAYQRRDDNYPDIYNLLEIQTMPFAYIPFIKLKENYLNNSLIFEEKKFHVNKFISKPVYSFENDIVYEFKTLNCSAKIVIYEYLPYFFSPEYHKITGYLNYKKNHTSFEHQIIRNTNTKTILLKFTVELLQNSQYSLKIPIKKLMKSFENYPHDSARGHFLIGTPIIYYLNNDSKYSIIHTKDLLMRIPEPDFSMPFNIYTYTFVLLGYFYLMVFKIVTGKVDSHWLVRKNNTYFMKIMSHFKKKKD